ncbi:hypothetical protein N7540_005330 [Penicillium herquei]|nr:hypothetical protein N7540_005330 [Penicillium herquei]
MVLGIGSARPAIEIFDAFLIGSPILNSAAVDRETASEELPTKSMDITNSAMGTTTGSVTPASDTLTTSQVSFLMLKTATVSAGSFLTVANSCQP